MNNWHLKGKVAVVTGGSKGIGRAIVFGRSRLLYPLLTIPKNAAIINFGSVAGVMEAQTGAPSAMAKSGLIQMGRNLAAEWAPLQIGVNTVSPWFTRTRTLRLLYPIFG